jgi:aspartyl protease family protein
LSRELADESGKLLSRAREKRMGKRLFWWLALSGWAFAIQAGAAVAVSGIFGKKAVLIIGDAAPRTVAVGQSTPDGVKVLEISGDTVVVEVDGRQERLRIGEQVVSREGSGEEVWIKGDHRGNFYVNGRINGGSTRFIVDTGAAQVSIGRSEARRLGLDLTKARRAKTRTATEQGIMVWLVKLDRVKVGGIELVDVDAQVFENDRWPYTLLGMSFLRHVEMVYDGKYLRLRKRL